MADNKKHIDDFIKSKMNNYQPSFSPSHWDKMKTSLSGNSVSKLVFLKSKAFKKISYVAASILILAFTYFILFNQNNSKEEVAKEKISQTKEVKTRKRIAQSSKTSLEKKEIQLSKNNISKVKKAKNKSTNKKSDNFNSIVLKTKKASSQQKFDNKFVNQTKETPIPQFTKISTLAMDIVLQRAMIFSFLNETKDSTKLSQVHVVIPTPRSKKKKNISLSFGLANDYFDLASNISYEGYLYQNKNKSYISPGFFVTFRTNKKINFKSGFSYTNKKYKIDYNNISTPLSPLKPTFSDIDLKYFEVPILLTYKYFSSENISLTISSGIVSSFLVMHSNQTLYFDNSSSKEPFSNYKNIRINPTLSTDINYLLFNDLSIVFSPTIRLNTSGGLIEGNTKEHDIFELKKILTGIYVGINYKF